VEEVIKRANESKYGLAAGVLTKNFDQAMRFVNAAEVGTVWINCYMTLQPGTPFDGYKESGVDHDLREEGLDSYLLSKTVVMKIPPKH